MTQWSSAPTSADESKTMNIALVTDELSDDAQTAIELATDWGIRDFELRGFLGRRVPDFSPYQQERLEEALARHGGRIVSISPGLFKIPFPCGPRERLPVQVIDETFWQARKTAESQVRAHIDELLPAAIAYARRMGVPRVSVFSFHRGGRPAGPPPPELVSVLRRAAEAADAAGLELAIEPEADFWADTGARTAELVRLVGHPALGVNWDPCNSLLAGDIPFPRGYEALRSMVRHVHFKDIIYRKDGWDFATEGVLPWASQIAALKADGYQGFISLEPHMEPKVAACTRSLAYLRRLLEV
jgi:sugar phosphate isomerase/epimerase